MLRSIHTWILLILLVAGIGLLWPRQGFNPEAFSAKPAAHLKKLKVMLLPHEGSVSRLSPFGPGFEQELVEEFARRYQYDLELTPADNPTHAWNALGMGVADVAVGLGHEPPASMNSPVAAGPTYSTHSPLIVGEDSVSPKAEICPVSLMVTANPTLEEQLQGGRRLFDCEPTVQYRTDHKIKPVLDRLRFEKQGLALVDEGRFRLWQPFYPMIKPQQSLAERLQYRWFWRTENKELETDLSSFWRDPATLAYVQALEERYYGFLPKETDFFELDHLFETLENKLPLYDRAIAREAVNYRIDPLLLAALIYQESRFDPLATSKTGVRGIMQLTLPTAEMFEVKDRLNPEQSIRGGARFLKQIWDDLEPLALEPTERWIFSLAAYNQGPGHLEDAIELAREQGGEGRTWKELKKVFPLLSRSTYANKAKYGYTRGWEAVTFVDKVRYYYYILNGVLVLSRPEAQNLATLQSVRSVFGAGPFNLASFGFP